MNDLREWWRSFWDRPTPLRAAFIVVFLGVSALYCLGIASIFIGPRLRQQSANSIQPTLSAALIVTQTPVLSATVTSTATEIPPEPTETPHPTIVLPATPTQFPPELLRGPTATEVPPPPTHTATEVVRPTNTVVLTRTPTEPARPTASATVTHSPTPARATTPTATVPAAAGTPTPAARPTNTHTPFPVGTPLPATVTATPTPRRAP